MNWVAIRRPFYFVSNVSDEARAEHPHCAARAALFSVSECGLLFGDGIVVALVPFGEGYHFDVWEHVVADGD